MVFMPSISLSERTSGLGCAVFRSCGEDIDLVTSLFIGAGVKERSWEWSREGVTVPELPAGCTQAAVWIYLNCSYSQFRLDNSFDITTAVWCVCAGCIN